MASAGDRAKYPMTQEARDRGGVEEIQKSGMAITCRSVSGVKGRTLR